MPTRDRTFPHEHAPVLDVGARTGHSAIPFARRASPTGTTALRVLAAVLCIAAAATVAPFWAPLVLAAWFADLLSPARRHLERVLHGKRRGAAAIVVAFVISVLVPVTGAVFALASHARALFEQARAALEGNGSLHAVLLGGGDAMDLASLATRSAGNAWRAATAIARASAMATIDVLLFVAALYSFLAYGRQAYEWAAARAPVPRDAFVRLVGAFRETGRGLLVAGGGTALVQGAIATAAYAAIGIPRAFILGPLTGIAAIVPAIGTAAVWLPLAVELTLSGSYGRAALVGVAGLLVSTVDNVVRPVLARHGRLRLPTLVVFASMLGGMALVGPTGALLGPLVVRLAVEALELLRDEQAPARDEEEESAVGVRMRTG